ncbi:MAG: outer membrane protein transport protein, partial [Kiritimatiellales bacterium]|nr:outer membrane protein transport protein [Kiritimatiellales bacterium]
MRPHFLRADTIAVPTPGGVVFLDLGHAGPTGQLVEPDPPSGAGFRPPTIFAAPLPTGSGARALGQAGAFTAVADDATAASWNPAGLTQLETSEFSAVYRFSAREDSHHSKTSDLETGKDCYNSSELNYASAVYPFLLNDQNAVFSMNYQETYDFTYAFTAQFRGDSQQSILSTTNQTFHKSTTNQYDDANQSITVISDITTETASQIQQLLSSSLLSGIDFRQSGTIDAISPAFAVELTPRFSLGVTVNFYTDGASRGNPIESTLVAEYEGTSSSVAEVTDVRNSTTLVDWTGLIHGGDPADPVDFPVSGTVGPIPFADTNVNTQTDIYTVEGIYREKNQTEQFYGFNATLGALWTATDRLTLGATVDLPWTGHGEQTKRIYHQITTIDSNQVQVAQNSFSAIQKQDVEYTFPLYWSLGALWRWNDRCYTSMDISRTYWSEYSYKADGEERINPINGEPQSSSSVEDCWSVRLGSEYLCVLSWTEIPLRGGVFWEQRPA